MNSCDVVVSSFIAVSVFTIVTAETVNNTVNHKTNTMLLTSGDGGHGCNCVIPRRRDTMVRCAIPTSKCLCVKGALRRLRGLRPQESRGPSEGASPRLGLLRLVGLGACVRAGAHVGIYACLHACLAHVCRYVFTYVCTPRMQSMQTCACMYACLYLFTCMCVYVCVCVCLRVCVCVRVWVYGCMGVWVYGCMGVCDAMR